MTDYLLIISDFFHFTAAFTSLTLLQKATPAMSFNNIMSSFFCVFFCLLHPLASPGSCVKLVVGPHLVSYNRHCGSGPSPSPPPSVPSLFSIASALVCTRWFVVSTAEDQRHTLAYILSGAAQHRRPHWDKDRRDKQKKKKRMQIRMIICVCIHPLVLILLVFLTGGGGGLSIRVSPSLFQLALDTPAPAETTPTQASHHLQLCEGQPCLNGGSCLALPSSYNQENTFEYTCSCSRGFTGWNCEVRTYCVVCLKAAHNPLIYLKEMQPNHNAKVVLCL